MLLLKSSCCFFLQSCIHLCILSCFFLLAMSAALEDSTCVCEVLTCLSVDSAPFPLSLTDCCASVTCTAF